MKFDLIQALEVLRATPRVLNAMLEGVSLPWVMSNYGPDTFSPFDVVGHLIHGDRTDWIPRARIILQHGPDRPFEPFDRYAMFEESMGKTIDELLETFAKVRRINIETVKGWNLTPEQLALAGTHPELGTVTLENLLATWVVHDLNHIHQVAKSLAFQYQDAVGPWKAYLSILPRGETA